MCHQIDTYRCISLISILLLATGCAHHQQYNANSGKPNSHIKVSKFDLDNDTSIDYVFYVDDENVEIQIAEQDKTSQDDNNSEEINYQNNTKKFTEELASKEASLRQQLDAEYDDKLNTAVSVVTSSYIDAQSFFYKKQYNQALNSIKTTISYAPESAGVLSLAGSIYYAAGYIDKSITYWKRALKSNPSLTQVRTMLRKAQTAKKNSNQ